MSHGIRWTEDQLSAHKKRAVKPVPPKVALPKVAAPKKYGNVHTDGYHSKREAKRAAELKLMEAAGEIRNLREQVKYILIPKNGYERECSYLADFVYEIVAEGMSPWEIVEDCKGVRTSAYIIKRKLMRHVHGIGVRET